MKQRIISLCKQHNLDLSTVLLGIGLALFPVHNQLQPGIFRIDGQLYSVIFLPQIAFCLIIVALGIEWQKKDKWDFGEKKIWIPLLIIVGSIVIQFFFKPSAGTFANVCFGVTLFGVYLVARRKGRKLWLVLLPFLVIESISVIVYGLVYPGIRAAGLITTPYPIVPNVNYDIATGFLIFTLLVMGRVKWWITLLVGLALFFTGAPEMIFAVGVITLVILIKRDFSRKLFVTVGIILLVAGIGIIPGYTQKIYSLTGEKLGALNEMVTGQQTSPEFLDQPDVYQGTFVDTTQSSRARRIINYAFSGRVEVMEQAIKNISFFGHGYDLLNFTTKTVHNLPLIIIDQIGILAGIAWLWVTLYSLSKSRWSYIWLAIIILSVFDHYIWTQMAFYWWAIAVPEHLKGICLKMIAEINAIFYRMIPHLTCITLVGLLIILWLYKLSELQYRICIGLVIAICILYGIRTSQSIPVYRWAEYGYNDKGQVDTFYDCASPSYWDKWTNSKEWQRFIEDKSVFTSPTNSFFPVEPEETAHEYNSRGYDYQIFDDPLKNID